MFLFKHKRTIFKAKTYRNKQHKTTSRWMDNRITNRIDRTLVAAFIIYMLKFWSFVYKQTILQCTWCSIAPVFLHGYRISFLSFQVVKMLVIVVVMFGICWLPLHLFNLMGDFTEVFKDVPHQQKLALFLGAHWLAMSNSFANPIIYGFTNETFRVWK